MRSSIALEGVAAAVLVMASPLAVDAQPAAVETLIREGVEQRKRGNDQLALPLFQKAYDLERSPRTAAQLGLAEASLGYWLASEQHLTEALTATRNPWLAKHEGELRKTLVQVRMSIGELVISGAPAGAEVVVNGQPAGKLPLARAVRLPEGAAQVTMRAPGFSEASAHTKIEGGKRAAVTLQLERAAPAVAAAGPVAVTGARPQPGVAGGPSALAAVARESEPAPPPSWVRPLSWAAASAATIALGVGGYGLYTQRARGKAFDDYKAPGTTQRACGASLADKGGARCAELYEQQQSARRLIVPGLVTGAVLAVAAVVGFASTAESDAPGGLSLGIDGVHVGQPQLVAGWTCAF